MPSDPNTPPRLKQICPASLFERLQSRYQQQFGYAIFAHDLAGKLVYGISSLTPEQCRFAAGESLRWGETTIQFNDSNGSLYWSVPVLLNNLNCGGIGVCDLAFSEDGSPGSALPLIRKAAAGLLELIIQENLIPEATLREARVYSISEQEKAEAIHLVKNRYYNSVQKIYTEEEPALLKAIRRGEREQATEILNRIFVAIYHYAGSSQDLLKSYLLELVAMMSRAAVEAGGRAESALGLNFQSITQLARLDDHEAIAAWLNDTLQQLFAEIQNSRDHPHSVIFNKAFAYMNRHLGENLKREAVARHVGLSSSHFAHLLTTYTGQSFRNILTELRVDQAARLLSKNTDSLAEIALVCGFSDQSHFSKVFSQATHRSPGEYRKQHTRNF